MSESVAWTATNTLCTDLVAHCLALDMAFHKAHTSGELIERIDGDVNKLSNFFSQFMAHLLTNAVLLIGVLIVLFFVDWRVGLSLTVFAVLALFIIVAAIHTAVMERDLTGLENGLQTIIGTKGVTGFARFIPNCTGETYKCYSHHIVNRKEQGGKTRCRSKRKPNACARFLMHQPHTMTEQ